jgi:hypothetical protein
MTSDSDDTIPERVDREADDDDLFRDETGRAEDHDESAVDKMRGSGVGVEDPNIVGDPHPGPVDAEVAEDEPPVV